MGTYIININLKYNFLNHKFQFKIKVYFLIFSFF